MHLSALQLVLLILLVIAVPAVMAWMIGHFFGIPNAHAHVNHATVGLVVLGLFAIALIKTDLIHNFVHSFDTGTAYASESHSDVPISHSARHHRRTKEAGLSDLVRKTSLESGIPGVER